jgi:tetratricopeptide (TPR) repeat protein
VEKTSSNFSRGNELYRSGDYAAAQEAYENVIEAYPHHAGGNINLTLALLQQEKNEDALLQALACVYLFPDNSGCLLNAQTAGVACGFKTSDIEYSLNRVLSSEPSGKARSVNEVIAESSEITYDQYDYNDVWARIEFELSTQNADSDDQKSTYGVLSDRVSNLAESADSGTDEQQLKEYLSAVGKSLGYE